ncbi:MAG: hypothetical protein CL811_13075 [Colwelliaceae bacterium]|nr:hypothetical protein [Colwelliaceae bacterium]
MKQLFSIIVYIVLLQWSAIASAHQIHVIGEHLIPYQSLVEGKIEGLAIDIAKELVERTQVQANYDIYPWARAYSDAQRIPNTLLLSVSRTSEREEKFKWIGRVVTSKIAYWRLKNRTDIQGPLGLHQLSELKISIQRNAVYHEYLKQHLPNTENLALTTTNAQAIKMLYAGRVDIMMSNEVTFKQRAAELGLDPDKLEKVNTETNLYSTLYLAFSKQTPDELVTLFKNTYKALDEEQVIDEIRQHWLP